MMTQGRRKYNFSSIDNISRYSNYNLGLRWRIDTLLNVIVKFNGKILEDTQNHRGGV